MNEMRSYNHNLKAQLILLRFILLCAVIREIQNRLAVLSLIALSEIGDVGINEGKEKDSLYS